MSSDKRFEEYQTELNKIIKYAITYEIQYSCDGISETYRIGKNKLVVTARPPISKPNKTWPWKIVPKSDQPICFEAWLDGRTPSEQLSPQWIFFFLKIQQEFQVKKIAVIKSANVSVRASA